MNDIKGLQNRIARRCWSADLSVAEAAQKILKLSGEPMPHNEICRIYKKEQEEFEVWLKIVKPD